MSGRRNNLRNFQVLTDGDSTSSLVSTPTDISGFDNITYQIKIDPTVDGELFVEFCNDANVNGSSVFDPLNFSQNLILNSAIDTEYMLKIQNHGFKWMRLSFTDNAGSGVINAWISGNTVGA